MPDFNGNMLVDESGSLSRPLGPDLPLLVKSPNICQSHRDDCDRSDANSPVQGGRRKEGTSVSLAQSVKNESSQEALRKADKKDEADRPRKKRGTRVNRCGECVHCRNPHWKKSCKAKDHLEKVARRDVKDDQTKSKNSGGLSEVDARSTSLDKSDETSDSVGTSKDKFAKLLRALQLTGDGGLSSTDKVPRLMDVMQLHTSTWTQRQTILRVLDASVRSAQERFVREMGLLVLQVWLEDAARMKTKTKFILGMLHVLERLPISAASLEPPCSLASLVTSLRRYTGENEDDVNNLRMIAKRLRNAWKEMYQASLKNSNEKEATDCLRNLGTASSMSSAAARLPAPVSSSNSESASARSSSLLQDPSSRRSSKAVAAATSKPSTNSLGDDDIFVASDKRKISSLQSNSIRNNTSRLGHQETEASKTSKTAKLSQDGAEAAKKPSLPSSSSTVPRSNPLDVILNDNIGEVSIGPESYLFAPHAQFLLTARERAAKAAARVPSPPPDERKRKKRPTKSVSWPVNEADLTSIRYFKLGDPPEAVQNLETAIDTKAPLAEENDALSAEGVGDEKNGVERFASAARREHLSEAQTLRAHRQQEHEEDLDRVSTRLDALKEQVAWHPPISMPMDPTVPKVGDGRESLEAREWLVLHGTEEKVAYRTIDDIPPSPGESLVPASSREPQAMNSIPRIPLSFEEAVARKNAREDDQRPHAGQGGTLTAPNSVDHVPLQGKGFLFKDDSRFPDMHQAGAAAFAEFGKADIAASLTQLVASGIIDGQSPNPMQNNSHPARGAASGTLHAASGSSHDKILRDRHPDSRPVSNGIRPMLGLHPPSNAMTVPHGEASSHSRSLSASDGPPKAQYEQRGSKIRPSMTQASRPRNVPCRYFNSPTGCNMGNQCRFAHVPQGYGEAVHVAPLRKRPKLA